jgi:ABC-type uncharacterized transport system auxiliary subunit
MRFVQSFRALPSQAFLASLAAFMLMAGCAAPQVPKEQYFRLIAAPAAAKIAHPLPGIAEAAPFAADGVLGERPLLFTSNGGSKLEQRSYALWTDAPTAMVRDQVVSYLRAAGVADQVVPSELRIGAAYRVQGNITRLEQEIGGKQSTGVLELELSVIDESDDHLVVSKVYHSEQTAKDNSIDGAATALDAALTDILKQFVADIDGR